MKRLKKTKNCIICKQDFITCWADRCRQCVKKIERLQHRKIVCGVYKDVGIKYAMRAGGTK